MGEGQRIAAHRRDYQSGGFSTLIEHMLKAHQEYSRYSLPPMIHWAKRIGPSTAGFIEHMMASRSFPQQAYRACYGLLRLRHRFGETRLEKACKKALLLGATRYQQVGSLLKNNLEEAP